MAVLLWDVYIICVKLDQFGAYVTLLTPIVLALTLQEMLPTFLGIHYVYVVWDRNSTPNFHTLGQ